MNPDRKTEFLKFAIEQGAMRFGSFVTKAGRTSPYFFNAGLFDSGAALARLAEHYADALGEAQIEFDMVFGPAYKGIPLAAALAVELSRRGRDVPFAFNRKEAKDHGQGGKLIGAPIAGRVLIVDDGISAGTSVRESIALIEGQKARPAAVAVALDRMEKGPQGEQSAVELVRREFGLPVVAVAALDDLLRLLQESNDAQLAGHLQAVKDYRSRYGA